VEVSDDDAKRRFHLVHGEVLSDAVSVGKKFSSVTLFDADM